MDIQFLFVQLITHDFVRGEENNGRIPKYKKAAVQFYEKQ